MRTFIALLLKEEKAIFTSPIAYVVLSVFLVIMGFAYSYFWSAGTIIYLLMRRNVDAAEMDEVYLEEEDHEGPYGGALAPAAPPALAPEAGTDAWPVIADPTQPHTTNFGITFS